MSHQAASRLASAPTKRLFEALQGDLRGFFARRVDPATADDLVQEVFVRVHQHHGELRDPERVASWVYRIARHVLTDHARKMSIRQTDPLLDDDAMPDDDADAMDADDRDAAIMLGHWLTHTIATLEPHYRDALDLVDRQGLSQREAARQLGLSYSGLKSRVQRGRAQLRQRLDDCCDVERGAVSGIVQVKPRGPCDCG